MSFLSQTFLFALPLALVPIVLHLINRKQREEVNWGAMQFLTEATVEGSRYQRLEELLLLACRVGLVLALILALARPMLRSPVFGGSAQRDVVVVLDNSLSTDRKIDDTTVYDQLREKTSQILDDLDTGDQIRVLLTAAEPGWLQSEPIVGSNGNISNLKKRLSQTQPTAASTNIRQSLQTVLDSYVDDEQKATDFPRTIVLLTDGQAFGWDAEATTAWQQLGKTLASPYGGQPIDLQVVFPDASETAVENIAVCEVTTRSNLVPAGEKTTFQARVLNAGASDQRDLKLHWTVDGEQQDESIIDRLAAGESRQLQWSTRLESKGCVRVACELVAEDCIDHISLDNSEQRIVEVTDRIPILVVKSATSYESSNGHVFFASALGYGESSSSSSWESVFEPTTIAMDELGSVELADFHAIVLNDATTLPDHVMEQITDYVHGGGGLWLALGSSVDITAFNSTWFDEGTGLCPWQLVDLATEPGPKPNADEADTQMPLIHQPDANHPALTTLAQTTQVDLQDVKIRQRYTFQTEDTLRPVLSLLETGGGEPLVVENFFGGGRVIVQAFPLGMSWSNLPLTRAYVVMVHDWLAYLTQPAATQYNLKRLTPIRLPRIASSSLRSVTIRPPYGEPIKIDDAELQRASTFRYGRTRMPGSYQVEVDSGQGGYNHFYQIAKDADESQLQQLTEEQRKTLQESLGGSFDGTNSANKVSQAAATALPTWTWLLLLLLALVFIEQILAGKLNQHRFGSPSSTAPQSKRETVPITTELNKNPERSVA